MKKFKKLASGLLATSLIAGLVAPVGAAPADVTDKDQKTAVERLGALKVLTGYTDGSFKPGNNITRAEFAAIAVRLLGLEGAVQSYNKANVSQFKDAEGHWAEGYISVAANQGLLKGYPDGTFKPENNVTYAESLAILVRALDYDIAVKGQWPYNYVSKATDIGLTDDAPGFTANTPATRGDVAIFADNALEIPMLEQTAWGDEKFEKSSNKTLLSEYFDITVIEDATVTDVFGFLNDGLDFDDKEVSVSWKEGDDAKNDTFKLTAATPTAYAMSLKSLDDVTVWVNDDDEIVYVQSDDRDSVKSDVITDVKKTGDKVEVHLDAADEWYELDGFVYNAGETTDANVIAKDGTISGAAEASKRLVINYVKDGEKLTYANIFNYNSPSVVDEVDVEDRTIDFKSGSLDLDDDSYDVLILDGKTQAELTLEDIKENDVVYTYQKGDNYVILVSKDKAEGEFKSAKVNDGKITVGDKTFTVVNKNFDQAGSTKVVFSTNEGEDVDADYDELLGQNVEAGIGLDGRAVYAFSSDATDVGPANYMFAYGAKFEDGTIDNEYYLTVFNKDGDKVAYKVNDDTEYEIIGDEEKAIVGGKGDLDGIEDDANVNKLTALFTTAGYELDGNSIYIDSATKTGNALVDLDVNDKGEIETIKVIKADQLLKDGDGKFADDSSATRIKTSAGFKTLAKDALVVAADDAKYAEVDKAIAATELEENETYLYYYLNEDEEVQVLFASENAGSSDDDFGVLVDAYETSKDKYAVILTDKGETKTLVNDVNGLDSDNVGFFYGLDLSGDTLDDVNTAVYGGAAVTYGDISIERLTLDEDHATTIDDVKSDRIELSNGSTLYFADDVVVFDASDDIKIIDKDAINEDDYVVYVGTDDGEVKYIVISDDADDVDVD